MKYAFAGVLVAFSSAVALAEDPQIVLAQKQLDQAMAAAKLTVTKAPSYLAAKQKYDAASAAVATAGTGAKAAVLAKMKAKSDLDAEAKRLLTVDPGVVAASNALANAKKQAVDAEQARIAAEQSKQAEAKDVVRKSTARYQQIVANKLKQKDAVPLSKTPLVGDEASLAVVRSKPQQYQDKLFVVTGVIKSDDYYNLGYSNAKPTHYSFSFRPINAKAQMDDSVSVYQLKGYGCDDLIRVAAAREEIERTGAPLIRLRLTISSAFVKNLDDAGDLYEMRDWQFYDFDAKQWGPWWSETAH